MKKNPQNGQEQVAAFFRGLDHALKPAMERVRELILSADDGITEHIKWKAPSFCHGGDDRFTFNIHRSGVLLVIFHRGAKIKDNIGVGRLIADESGLLFWKADDRAMLKFTDLKDIEQKKERLQVLVRQWIKAAKD